MAEEEPRLSTIHSRVFGLTHRQREVADAVMLGLTNKEIASQLGISEQCVKEHVSHILRKAGAGNRTQLVARIRANGNST